MFYSQMNAIYIGEIKKYRSSGEHIPTETPEEFYDNLSKGGSTRVAPYAEDVKIAMQQVGNNF